MKIYIMRHGEAEQFADSDAERELTLRGREESRIMAEKCRENGIEMFDKVLVSPYIRAQQTWQELNQSLSAKEVQLSADITPYGDAEAVFDYLSALIELEKPQQLLLVSHLPLVGYLTAELVPSMAPLMFATSAIAAIEFDEKNKKGDLLWQWQP
ncbi:phosphohistidine phosphatase SixA [Vibrio sp. SM6]|uniref:Phosphohistidine phosphatase SixA n=1 Tax=Vibrio agarilyticus TaxID=2726741 RepID=A0A7X8YH65_9VIBR|nr:phosphohistidine phosphatase SixA [Vibrio agarilyticus]NLS13270.1 phosphohistidine phosphatase SixA [Vibrio agarilyticus]